MSAPPERRVELLPGNFQCYRQRFAANPSFDYDAAVENVILFGTPEQVAERVETLRQGGVENLILFVNYGGIESQKVKDSLKLFAAEVIPHFRDLSAAHPS